MFKRICHFGFVVLLVTALALSCSKEIPPTITPCQTSRVVLVEEFTGVSCVNCPTGADKLKLLSQQNPGKIVVVGVHAGYFAAPSSSNTYLDLRCDDGQSIESQLLGPVSGYPSASINRKLFDGESQYALDLNAWAGYINTEICDRPIAEVNISSSFNNNDTTVNITVDVVPNGFFTDLLPEDLALSVMITESNIIGYQLTPTGSESNYTHKHVLRDVISDDYSGDVIIAKGNILSAKSKTINNYKIPADWNPENCHVVAFIHNKAGGNNEVLQASEISIK